MSTKNRNHKVVDNAFWKGNKSMPTYGTPKHVCAKRRVESFPAQGKVCSQAFDLDLNNLAQGHLGDVCQQEAYASSGPC